MGNAIANTIKGIVIKVAGEPKPSNYPNGGMVASIRVQRFDGTTEDIWQQVGSPIFLYRQNDPIEYTRNGKNIVFINQPTATHRSDNAPVNVPKNAQNTEGGHTRKWEKPSSDERLNLMNYSTHLVDIHSHIFDTVVTKYDKNNYNFKDEILKDITTTIFIQTIRKFNY